MATLKDIATRAGVSQITVSREVSGYPHVSGETREKVRTAIRELKYVPNHVARSLVIRDRRPTAIYAAATIRRIQAQSDPQSVLLEPALVVRGSTTPGRYA
jgi:DNA-binding LacI/PurR family transcriptional regulator